MPSFEPNLLFTGAADPDGYPVVTMDGLRLAQHELTLIPPQDYKGKPLPDFIMAPFKEVFNNYKVHSRGEHDAARGVEKLLAHRRSGTFPAVVLTAAPGCPNIHIDNVLSDDARTLLLERFEGITNTARNAMLGQLIGCRQAALNEHRRLASLLFVTMTYRDKVIDNLQALGQSLGHTDSVLPLIVRGLSLLIHKIRDRQLTITWNNIKKQRAKEKVLVTAADTIMHTSSGLTSSEIPASIDAIVTKKVSQAVRAFGKLKSGSPSHPPGPARSNPHPYGSRPGSSYPSASSRGSTRSSRASSGSASVSRPSSSGSGKCRCPNHPRLEPDIQPTMGDITTQSAACHSLRLALVTRFLTAMDDPIPSSPIRSLSPPE